MLLNPEGLYVGTSTYDRSLEAARMYELNSAVNRQRQHRRNQKRTELRRWIAARRTA